MKKGQIKISVNLPEVLLQALEIVAVSKGITVEVLVTRAVEEKLVKSGSTWWEDPHQRKRRLVIEGLKKA